MVLCDISLHYICIVFESSSSSSATADTTTEVASVPPEPIGGKLLLIGCNDWEGKRYNDIYYETLLQNNTKLQSKNALEMMTFTYFYGFKLSLLYNIV